MPSSRPSSTPGGWSDTSKARPEQGEPMDIKAHITGTIWKIEVAVGDEVEEDDVVIILESMKMEMPIEAPADGNITEILAKEGDAVKEGQVLAKMEED